MHGRGGAAPGVALECAAEGLNGRECVLKTLRQFQPEELTPDSKIKGRYAFTGYQPTFMQFAQQRGFDCTVPFHRVTATMACEEWRDCAIPRHHPWHCSMTVLLS